MVKIDKTDLENISLLKKTFKLKNFLTIRIKKGNYEIELSTQNNYSNVHSLKIVYLDKTLYFCLISIKI